MNVDDKFAFKKIYQEHIRLRNLSLHKLKLPFTQLRSGQKQLLLQISDSIAKKQTFVLNAPTGFGKTFVCLLPALANLAKGKIKRIYYFTNQESQRNLPVNLLLELRKLNDITLWTQIIYSSERCCQQHDFCYVNNDKKVLQQVAQQLLANFNGQIDFSRLQKWAQEHHLCPYLLQIELATYADVLILDYNYLFDPLQQLKELKNSTEHFALLLDEAHNLPRRGQEIYQVKFNLQNFWQYERLLKNYLQTFDMQNCQAQSKNNFMQIFACLGKITEQVKNLSNLCKLTETINKERIAECLNVSSSNLLINQTGTSCQLYIRQRLDELSALLIKFCELFVPFSQTEGRQLLANYNEFKQLKEQMQSLKRLQYLLDNYSESFITSFHWQLKNKQVYADFIIYCLDAMPLMIDKIPKEAGKIFFSATLLPLNYYAELFTPEQEIAKTVSATSPFPVENRQVGIITYADLSYKNRNRNAKLIAKSLLAYLKKRQGHFLVFAPSYSYQKTLWQELSCLMPNNYRLLVQEAAPSLQNKQKLISLLQDTTDTRPLLVLAVLQSAFSEGLDLPGNSITAVAIVGTGLPAKSDLLSLQQEYFSQRYLASKISAQEENQIAAADYYELDSFAQEAQVLHVPNQAYLFSQLYPSFSKIIQACGRLIRTETDKGEILLFDERFKRPEYKQLLKSAFGDYDVIEDLNSYVTWLNSL